MMVIGPVTIRWTKDIITEQIKRDDAKRVSARLVELLMHTHRRDRAILRHWGLCEGLIEQRADNTQEAPLSPPRGRP